MQRVDAFYIDCEFSEYVANFHSLLGDKATHGFIFKIASRGQNKGKNYPHLRTISESTKRKKVVHHLRQTIYSSFIKDLYEEVCLYLVNSMKLVIEKRAYDINRFLSGNDINITAKELLQMTSYNDIIKYISDCIFHNMESEQKKSHTRPVNDVIMQFEKRFGVSVDNKIKNEALPYLMLRHVLVHDDRKPQQEFLDRYPQFKVRENEHVIRLDHKTIEDAYSKVTKLIKEIDNQIDNLTSSRL